MRNPFLLLAAMLAGMSSTSRAMEDRRAAADIEKIRQPLALPRGGGGRSRTFAPVRERLLQVDRFGAGDGGQSARNAVKRFRQGRASIAQTRAAVKRAVAREKANHVRAAA